MNWGLQWPTETYPIIVADPPWDFRTYSKKGRGRSPDQHYPVMSLQDITDLPVSQLVQKQTTLFLWTTWDLSEYAQSVVMPAWGFKYKTDAFVWAKSKKHLDKIMLKAFRRWQKTGEMPDPIQFLYSMFRMGKGYYTRKETEVCLLGTTKGVLPRSDKGVPDLIVGGVREHSRKPDETYDRIERLYDVDSYLELFARASNRPRWDAWGNDTDKFEINEPRHDAVAIPRSQSVQGR